MIPDPRLELAEAAAYGSFNDGGELPVLRIAGATCYATPAAPESTMLNRVVALGIDGDATNEVLDEIDVFFREATRYAVAIAPQAPPELAEQLLERGFTEGYAWMKFARSLDEPPVAETRLHVALVEDGEDFAGVLVAAYELPAAAAAPFGALAATHGWHLFVAYDGTEPVGGAALFVHENAGWLGAAGTLPEHRGKGAQSALLAARIGHARELGLDLLATETGERQPDRPSASYRNILRAGFEEAYVRPNLVSPAATA